MDLSDLANVLWLLFIIAGIAIMVTWLVVMNKAIDQVSHDLRRMEPGAVWLCLIPLFGLVWQFMVINAVAEGISKELLVRNMFPKEEKPAFAMGLTGCILICFCIIPYIGPAFGLIGLIFMVIHAVKISAYNRELEQSGRWEVRYNARMAAIRQQMDSGWQQQPNPYNNRYPAPQAFQQAPPMYMPPAPPPSYAPPDTTQYSKKDKPENPFS
jgi:hypothetical protein